MSFNAPSTTRASLFSLSAFSSSSVFGSVIRKAIALPSGDQSIARTPPFSSVSASASPPSTRMRQTLGFGSLPSLSFGPRPERKAIHFPSGDQAGSVDDLSPEVSANVLDPSARATCT